uniref:Ubiquitin-like domain-containing protein n=1 Tax=Mastacembelus armatus TaxID=205130 RepID=A0A3Q3MEE0_9TELE
MGKLYQVVVHGLRGEKMVIDLCNTEEQMQSMTVKQLKEKIAQRLPESTGEEALRLIFADKMLDGDSTLLSTYGIQQMSNIHMVMRVPGGLI